MKKNYYQLVQFPTYLILKSIKCVFYFHKNISFNENFK